MPDTPDLTPPPDQPLPDDVRAEIRRQLAAAAAGGGSDQGAHRSAGRSGRWTIPAVAAAAVIAVVLGVFAVGATRDDKSGPGGDSLQPAATSTGAPGTDSPTPTTAPPTKAPTTTSTGAPGTDSPTPTTAPPTKPVPATTPTTAPVPATTFVSAAPTEPSTVRPGHGFPRLPDKPVSCDDEVAEFARMHPDLRGASVTAERDTAIGTIYLYETKTAWVVCDDSTAVTGGPQSERGYTPTLISFHQKSGKYEPNLETLAISENYLGTSGGTAYFFAAGRDFDGIQAISYAFPDGHTEDAVVGKNGLWSMSYLPTEGVLADPKTITVQLDQIQVTVRYSYDDTVTSRLQWGLDTCAQLNHGC